MPSASALSPPYDTPPNGGKVRVAEKGFSARIDGNTRVVSYGIVFENDGDQVAFLTDITIRMIDQAGKPIADSAQGNAETTRQVRVILPGQKVGIGGTSYLNSVDVAELEVEMGKTAWWPIKNDFREFAEINAYDISTTLTRDPREATLNFLIESKFQRFPPKIWAWMIFRNSTGDITGGTVATPVQFEVSAGNSNKAVGKAQTTSGVPAAIDATKTTIYLLNDCC